ncbi:MAG: tRNA 2-selenouridine(34) synthase MnmH, partial [Paracoccaceae bacterium]|nr:tRNA 2-selenouridine(34) synthase MnmH [Paracoccaceae bacterium]
PLHPREVIEGWQAQGAAGDFAGLADSLMERHYDPRYGKHRERMATPVAEIATDRLQPQDLPDIAERLARAVRQLG